MAEANPLMDFLVSLGFKVDEVSARKMVDTVQRVNKDIAALAVGVEAATVGVIAGLGKMAQGFETLFYASKRTGSSVQELKAFGYAVSQLGGNADEAVASLEGLAVKLKSNEKGMPAFLASITKLTGVKIDPNAGAAKVLTQVGEALSHMDNTRRRAFAGELNLSERELNALTNYKEMARLQDEMNAKAKVMGVDLQQAAKDGQGLTTAFRSLGGTFGIIRDKIGSDLFKGLSPGLKGLNDYLLSHGREISDVVVKIADALLKMFTYVVENLPDVDKFVKSIGGWEVALGALGVIVAAKVLGPLGAFSKILTGLVGIVPPQWLLLALGLTGASLIKDQLKGPFDRAFDAVTGNKPDEAQIEMRKEGVVGTAKRLWNDAKNFVKGGGSAEDGRKLLDNGRPGKLSANQREAYQSAVAEGLNPTAARALVANMTGEGLHVPHDVHKDGPNQYAHGIVQWDDTRSAAIRAKFGKMPNEMSVAEQTKAAIWEMKTNPKYRKTWDALQGNNAGEMVNELVRNYESPRDVNSAIAKRRGIYQGLGNLNANPSSANSSSDFGKPVPQVTAKPGTFNIPPIRNPMVLNPDHAASTRGLGYPGPQTMNDNRVHMPTSTTINVTGVSDPNAAAGQMASNMTRQHSTLLRNLQSAIG